jgi:cobalamin biosynthesis Mg chelatase CobN
VRGCGEDVGLTVDSVATINCDVVNSMTASCTESYVYAYTDSGGDGTSTVTSTVFTDWNDWEITVTVTAGDTYAGGPAQSTATTSAGGLGTTTDADPVGQGPTGVSTTRTSLESSAEASQTTAAASTTAASSSQSTAGMPKVTGNAVLAGVAAVFGGVLLMI